MYGPQATRDLAISSAAKLLDCKQFVKDYKPEKMLSITNPFGVNLSCLVELMELSEEEGDAKPPPELIVLSPNAAISDLKYEASRAFQEVYLMFKRFKAEELVGYAGVDESTQLKLLLGSTETVEVRGRCLGKNGVVSRFRMERGLERWTVDCSCGAKDDDGERMLACDGCGVWQHTRCAEIPDSAAVPARFICWRRCGSSATGQMVLTPESTRLLHCKDETPAMAVSVVGGAGPVPPGFVKSLTPPPPSSVR